jgi:hypothetical protein
MVMSTIVGCGIARHVMTKLMSGWNDLSEQLMGHGQKHKVYGVFFI